MRSLLSIICHTSFKTTYVSTPFHHTFVSDSSRTEYIRDLPSINKCIITKKTIQFVFLSVVYCKLIIMSLQWTIIATFLYAEIAFVLLLSLPIASPSKWQKFFRSKFLAYISGQASIYFLILIGVLVLCLLDAIREMQKYSNLESTDHQHLDAEMQGNMRLFRAQRNFYISGFALFLLVVIRRLVTMISELASLLAQSEANFRQAQSATVAARSLLTQQGAGEEKTKKDVEELQSKVNALEKELSKEKKDKEAVKSQAESLNREYDRLAEEHSKLQKKITISSGGDAKKDE